jgi:hypothetical protein
MPLREISLPYLILSGTLLCFGIASAAVFLWLGWSTLCSAGNSCNLSRNPDMVLLFWVPAAVFSCFSFGGVYLALRQSRAAWAIGLLLAVALAAHFGFLYWLTLQSWT